MAITTTYVKGDGDALANQMTGKQWTKKFTIDTATTNVANGEIVKLMEVPADQLITNMIFNVTTAEGDTLTIDVGDYLIATDVAVTADGFADGLNGNSAVTSFLTQLLETEAAAAGTDYSAGKYYDAHDSYIACLFNNAADAAVIEVIVIGVDCR